MTSGKVTTDAQGRRVVVDECGRRYRVLGDQIGAGPDSSVSFTGERTARRVAAKVEKVEDPQPAAG